MDAIVYTADDREYAALRDILATEQITVVRDPLDGHGHYEYGYQLAVVAVEGARGMEIVKNWADRYRDTLVIWITGDPYFAGVAMEKHIHDFIERPYDGERLRRSVRRAKTLCPDTRQWCFRPAAFPNGTSRSRKEKEEDTELEEYDRTGTALSGNSYS